MQSGVVGGRDEACADDPVRRERQEHLQQGVGRGRACRFGAFAFSDLREDELRGKLRQEFANGWLGLESFGRSTFVAVCNVTQAEIDAVTVRLAAHFTAEWGAPSLHDALPVAEDEIRYMREMCEEHAPNTLLVVERHIAEDGVREAFRTLVPAEADLGDISGRGGSRPCRGADGRLTGATGCCSG